MTFTADDALHMAHALRLAERGRYTTAPNPNVGCVLVRDGVVVGEGWHEVAGGPHAEINALKQAGDKARGATAYVTLEPCAHQGRTGPCAGALLVAGVSRVVAAMQDPNPNVAGKGFEILKSAGIAVEHGLMQAEAAALNPGFLKRMRAGKPWVTVKLGMSLDGRTALGNGESKWITGEAARRDVQFLRARHQAILTGIGTVLADDPQLTVRLTDADWPDYVNPSYWQPPLRVVLDSQGRLPPGRQISNSSAPTLVCLAGKKADKTAGKPADSAKQEPALPGMITALRCGDGERVDLPAVLAALAERQINAVLVEAGATLAGAFLAAGLVDELMLYVAPKLLGDSARPLLQLPVFTALPQCPQLKLVDVRQLGDDLRLTLRP
ncbi:bifunctional diaminohydroxyphosphoribosylaminopyrimidine deaminase/5-amino-6-(5-phosphoribosylamino)uracil reductase RibD [Permianibacter sp. IMCC34836]|uniref:bifunctional diaminohydroxyphosphoribosylaminopyrimidine deaminase/5-amino-6-(5-phosphoribosylamino)uracil reductase RibD n=1 Tax=Permianibacter fluminis TaxID=2738515 RepID=UPI001558345B|nr:bifunctional diaminohydroxyphosphoribosylaminopyrimidine deaminase/5-amino-6-(5-phosphoribosylamino)uracil reductase RibD [Permianibacter fluminis]NQD36873.1 bifunctional diaminohydroxyphosphoribosylaminopyrimidine deaminase/5-amino-6-(5-phosphoribosylamino)uracil reductase RibD [Permianibacter fluminis]